MAKYPALTLWTDAYLADTHPALTLEEHGAYLLLLMFMWRAPRQRIPNDDEWLARNLSISIEDVEKIVRPLIKQMCKNDGNYITQKRLKIEWKLAQKRSKNQSVSAKARWDNKKDGSKHDAKAMPDPMPKSSRDYPSGNASTATATDGPGSIIQSRRRTAGPQCPVF